MIPAASAAILIAIAWILDRRNLAECLRAKDRDLADALYAVQLLRGEVDTLQDRLDSARDAAAYLRAEREREQ